MDPAVLAGSGSHPFRARPAASSSLSGAVLAAYQRAVAASPPQCHLTVSLLAAIGQVESGNMAGHQLDAAHRVVPAILGPVLNGRRFRAIADTDGGHWDGNTRWDRALGPLQFIPSTWRAVGVDLDGDGVRDPQDLYDAAGAAMVYLCAGGRDLATEEGLRAAILAYNHSMAYLRLVLAWKAAFDSSDLTAWGSLTLTATAIRALSSAPGPRPGRPAAHVDLGAVAASPGAVAASPGVVPAEIPADTPATPASEPQPSAPPPPSPVQTAAPDPAPVPTSADPCPATTTATAAPSGDPTSTTTPNAVPTTTTPAPGDPTAVPDPCAAVPGPTPAPAPAPTPAPTPTP